MNVPRHSLRVVTLSDVMMMPILRRNSWVIYLRYFMNHFWWIIYFWGFKKIIMTETGFKKFFKMLRVIMTLITWCLRVIWIDRKIVRSCNNKDTTLIVYNRNYKTRLKPDFTDGAIILVRYRKVLIHKNLYQLERLRKEIIPCQHFDYLSTV